MSWMDSWSRPSKSTQFPPPLYLITPDIPYCKTCGRVISSRRNIKAAPTPAKNENATQVKYCSERCRRTKPGKVDAQIEDAFVACLKGDLEIYEKKYPTLKEEGGNEVEKGEKDKPKISKKGDARNIVNCSEIERLVFGSRFDPEKTAGRRKNRVPRGIPQVGEWRSVDMEDPPTSSTSQNQQEDSYPSSSEDDDDGGVDYELEETLATSSTRPNVVDADYIYFSAGKLRPDQSKAEVNGSVGGEKGWAEKIAETDEMLEKRMEGQRRAREREMVRRAARRGVVFGFVIGDEGKEVVWEGKKKGKGGKGKEGEIVNLEGIEQDDSGVRRRKCEAVVTKAAVVVEPSFAKGDWGIRWREGV